MAVLKNIALAAAVLAPLISAIPLVDRRGIFTHTETVYTWTTVEETVTIYADGAEQTASVASASAPAVPVVTTSSSTSVAALTTATSVPGGVFYQNTLPASTLTTQWAPASSSDYAAGVPASSPASSPANTWATPSVAASSAVVPVSSSAPQATATGSTSGTCEGQGSACTGDVTHWDGGLGACGWNVDTNSDMQIALPHGFMGTLSNSNPYCGRSVTLYNPTSGTTVQATVGDKCMGCENYAIDCTDALFNAITDGKGDGRLSGIEWWLS